VYQSFEFFTVFEVFKQQPLTIKQA